MCVEVVGDNEERGTIGIGQPAVKIDERLPVVAHRVR